MVSSTEVLTWSREQSEGAMVEGWDIFEVSGYNPNNAPYQLQRLDDSELLSSDEAAWAFVRGKANRGNALHQAALAFLRQNSRTEYDLIMGEG